MKKIGLKMTTTIFVLLTIVFVGSGLVFAQGQPKFETPVFLTTAGQSIDWETVNILLKRLRIDYDYDNLAGPSDLEGTKTLIVVPAHSNKGLGSAGIDIDGEMKRIRELLPAAAERGIPLILVHVGGEIRRGAYSDPFIDEVIKYAEYVVVWEPGNADGYFTKYCKENDIPLVVIDKVALLTDVLKGLFVTE